MELFIKSDVGLVRKENQDSAAGGMLSEASAWTVVCDGMGGANGGETASALAVTTVKDFFENEYDPEMEKTEIVDQLVSLVQKANIKIYETQKNDKELKGMGTTIELVLVKDNLAHVVHVGDSRVYSIRKNKMQQITKDHSLVQEMVEKGEITQEEARFHPNKNYITRALGVSNEVYIDYIEVPFDQSDIIISCSDGMSNHINPALLLCFATEYKAEELAEKLIEKAKENGGSDNITVAVISS